MPITAQQVWDTLPPSARRDTQGDANKQMELIVDAVEAHWLSRWSRLIRDADGNLPNPRPANVDLALITQAAKLWSDQKVPGGYVAGGAELGAFRINRFHPNVVALLGSWAAVG